MPKMRMSVCSTDRGISQKKRRITRNFFSVVQRNVCVCPRPMLCIGMVGECSGCDEVLEATRDGAAGSKNVGTSNRKSDEKSDRRKSKVSLAMEISQGLVGPKAMAKAAADGQLVNIPAPLYNFDDRTECSISSARLDVTFPTEGALVGKSASGGYARFQVWGEPCFITRDSIKHASKKSV